MSANRDPVLQVQDVRFLDLGPYTIDAIYPGRIIGLTGPSGAGKSLFLQALADLIPHEGQVSLDGKKQQTWDAPTWRKWVMLVPAEPLWWHSRAEDHFPDQHSFRLSSLGIEPSRLNAPVSELSTGEKQRLSIARALSRRPRIVMFDEPTANMDADNAARIEQCVLDYLKEENAAAIWVTHDQSQLQRMAHRAYRLEPSHLVTLSIKDIQ